MALSFKFQKETMDTIMDIVREYGCNPSEAVDILVKNYTLIREAKNAEQGKEGQKRTLIN